MPTILVPIKLWKFRRIARQMSTDVTQITLGYVTPTFLLFLRTTSVLLFLRTSKLRFPHFFSSFAAQRCCEVPLSRGSPSACKRYRNSEDFEGDIDIERYLHRTDPFRSISFPTPDPTALKVTTTTAEEDPAQHLHRGQGQPNAGGPKEPDASKQSLRSASSSSCSRNPPSEFSTLRKDTYYIKQDRTFNVTGAMNNGVVAVCNWKTRYESYDSNGNIIEGEDLHQNEFMIIGVQGPFIESGDSGSFVVGLTGPIAGLIFADYKHNFQLPDCRTCIASPRSYRHDEGST